MGQLVLSAFAWELEENSNFVTMEEWWGNTVRQYKKSVVSTLSHWFVWYVPYTSTRAVMHVCILGVCTGINVSDICQQRDVEMLPTASRRSAAICSQRFAALKRSRKLYNFLYVKLVAKFAFFFFSFLSMEIYFFRNPSQVSLSLIFWNFHGC